MNATVATTNPRDSLMRDLDLLGRRGLLPAGAFRVPVAWAQQTSRPLSVIVVLALSVSASAQELDPLNKIVL